MAYPAAGKPLYEAQYSDFLRRKDTRLRKFWRNWRNRAKKLFCANLTHASTYAADLRKNISKIKTSNLQKKISNFFFGKSDVYVDACGGFTKKFKVRFAKKHNCFAQFSRRRQRMRENCAKIAPLCLYNEFISNLHKEDRVAEWLEQRTVE